MPDYTVYVISIIKQIKHLMHFAAFSENMIDGANFRFGHNDDGNYYVYDRWSGNMGNTNFYDGDDHLSLSDLKKFTNFKRRDKIYLTEAQYKVYKELIGKEFFSDEDSD